MIFLSKQSQKTQILVWVYISFSSLAGIIAYFELLPFKVNNVDSVLSTAIGALVSILVTTCSFIFVALQLVSIQFSPRVVRQFWQEDYFTKLFVGVYFLCIGIGFISLSFDNYALKVWSLSISTMAFVVFFFFLNHISESINAASITENIAQRTIEEVKSFYHSKPITQFYKNNYILSKNTGYIDGISFQKLAEAFAAIKQNNQENNLQLHFLVQIGEFVDMGTKIFHIINPESPTKNIQVSDSLLKVIHNTFEISKFRNIYQDVNFGIRQLVDIAIKAISPAVNDPTTAVNCIHHLGSIIKTLALADDKVKIYTELAQKNIFLKESSFKKYLDNSFDQIYQWGKEDYIIVRSILKIFADIIDSVQSAEKYHAILSQVDDMGLDYLWNTTIPAPEKEIKIDEHRKVIVHTLFNFYEEATLNNCVDEAVIQKKDAIYQALHTF